MASKASPAKASSTKASARSDASASVHPNERSGFRFMILGFFLILFAGLFYYIVTDYRSLGHVLFAAGLGVYVMGRILRTQGRRARARGEKK